MLCVFTNVSFGYEITPLKLSQHWHSLLRLGGAATAVNLCQINYNIFTYNTESLPQ